MMKHDFQTLYSQLLVIAIISCCGCISTLSAQNNKYGMALSGEVGSYTLTDASSICPIIPGGCTILPADAYEAYAGYQPEIISDNDYQQCNTLKYTFKTYPTHSLTLEVDIPKLSTAPHPFIIWVHGGGWAKGGTSAFLNQSRYLASRGIAGVRITYSLISQKGNFDLGMQELADALEFIQKHATEWNLDTTRFGYAAGSAGTPLASLAAMKHNGNGCKLYMGCNGMYDFQHNLAGTFASGASNYLLNYPTTASRRVISAINHIPGDPVNIPSVTVFHGTADYTISYLQSTALCDSISSKGGHAEKYIYNYYVHGFFNKGKSDKYEDVMVKMYAFAKSVFENTGWKVKETNTSEKINFDLNWKFTLQDVRDAEDPAYNDKSWRVLNLPHDWSIEGEYKERENGTDWQSGYLPAGIGWYRKTFDLNTSWKNKQVQVLFEGAYLNSDVWINGHHLGHRPNGYVSFYYDLTPYLKEKNNVIAVKIDHSKPLSGRWYTGSGLYRSVHLVVHPKTYIEPWGVFFQTPEVNRKKADFKVDIEYQLMQKKSVVVSARLVDHKGKTVAQREQKTSYTERGKHSVTLTGTVANPNLWSTDTPYVYRLICAIEAEGRIIDEFSQLVGFRKLEFSASEGFKLNDVPMKIKGVCDHHSAGAVGAAVPDDVMYRRLKILKEMGCNSIRTAHNPYAPSFYAMCDTLGFLVMNEAFDGWEKAKARDDYGNYFEEWWKTDLTAFIKRDRNHPSVYMWSIGNEVSAATPATQKKLVDFIHALDPTRLVTQGGTDPTRGMTADYEKNFQYLDVVGFNGNGEEVGEFERFQEMNPGRPAVGTEVPHTYQTRGVYRTKTTWRRRDFPAPWELKNFIPWDKFKSRVFDIPDLSETEVFPEESENKYYQSSYDNASVRISARHSWQRTSSFPFLMGEYRWGSFDYLGEAEWPQRCGNFGIIDICGFPKDHYYLYQSLWSDKPMVHLLPHWTHPGKEGIEIPVVVYTNCESAELFLNGQSLGKKAYVGEQLVWHVPYQAGDLKVIAYNGSQSMAEKSYKTAGKAAGFKVTSDKQRIKANQKDVIHVEIDIVDAAGNFCPMADNLIQVELSGAARILAIDNGDPIELSPYRVKSKKAFRGKCLLMLQATDKTGFIEVNITSPGLKKKTLQFRVVI